MPPEHSTSPDELAKAVKKAKDLPSPAKLRYDIAAHPIDDGIRASSYEARTRGGSKLSHPERSIGLAGWEKEPDPDNPGPPPRTLPDPTRAIEAKQADGEEVVVLEGDIRDAVGALNSICREKGAPVLWETVLSVAADITKGGKKSAFAAAWGLHYGKDGDPDYYPDTEPWAGMIVRSVERLGDLAAFYNGRPATPMDADKNEPWCQNHARVGIPERRETRMLCQWCWRWLRELDGQIRDEGGDVIPLAELQLDPRYWPTKAMLHAHASGSTVTRDREAGDWLRSHGVNPVDAQRRAQARRKTA